MTTTVNTINGNEGNNRLTGTSRNDVINGNGGNDKLSGGLGDDTLNGGAGKDELNGGSGNDVLDGGSGSDELEGGSGNDTLIYTLAENNVIGKFTYDEYEGGSGSDTLELRFTRAEWMNINNQTVLQNYINWASKSGSGCRWDDDFTFKFGNARLEIEDIEKLVVKVDGVTIKDLGINTVDAVDDIAGSITEDVTDVQKIYFLRNDNVNYLVKDVNLELSTTIGNVMLVKEDPDNTETWYFKYSTNNVYQYLQSDMTEKDIFKYTVIDAKGKEDTAEVKITITGVNDVAIISGTTSGSVTESGSSNNGGTPKATGKLFASDVDNDLNTFQATSTDQKSFKEYGKYSITADGNWTYKLDNDNDTVKALNSNSEPLEDTFTIYSIDGTPQTITITIQGADDVVNSAPVVKELGQGDNKYAGTANVEELINLKYDNPIIAKYVAKGGDFDYLHVRTGQFTFSDADLADKDKFTITSKAAGLEGNLGALTFDNYTKAKNSSGNIIDGEYVVKWTYTVKDSELDSLNAPTAGSSSKDDDFIVTINDGTTTIDTKIMLNLFGRDEIEFIDGLDSGNNVYEATDGPNPLSIAIGNDVFYLGDGDDSLSGRDDSTQVVYGENGNDTFNANSLNTVFFGGDTNDIVFSLFKLSNGLFFGGNGDDIFVYSNDITAQGRKTYAWGGAGSDFFEPQGKLSKSIDWIMDFDARNPDVGGDKINLSYARFDFNWVTFGANLEKKSADDKHPFLSKGAEYYDLQINSVNDMNNPIWLSVLNLVGVDGTEITLDGLIANGNLV